MHYADIKKADIANGLGVRVSVFVSGCTHHCKNCFNSEAWDFNYGNEFTENEINRVIKELDHSYVSGLSVLGGEPLEHVNQQGLLPLLKRVKEKFPDTLLLFVTPPSAEELKSRLVGRGTETMDVIEFRMNRAKEEALEMDQYDYLIINDDLQECVEEMHQIIQGEHRRSFRNAEFIEHMKEELKGE